MRLLVLYGSQTGYAQDAAERVGRAALRRGLSPEVAAMDEYDPRRLPGESLAVFVASTTGQGEAPDNMRRFWRFLRRKDIPPGSLSATHFSVFGLGDSSYPVYNAVARRLYQRMLDLGARPVVERGLGDDQHPRGFNGTFEPWMDALWAAVAARWPGTAAAAVPDDEVAPPAYSVALAGTGAAADAADAPFEFGSGAQRYRPAAAPVLVNRRLTSADNEQDVRHIEIDVSAAGLPDRAAGDVLVVHPRNPDALVEGLCRRLGLDPDAVLLVERRPPHPLVLPHDAGIPARLTARRLFGEYLGVAQPPTRRFFEVAALHASDPMHREKLAELASAEGQDDLYRYCTREARTLLEVLDDFPSVSVPLGYLPELVPRLQPRQFSLSSSPAAHPGRAHVTVAVVRYRTPYGREKRGVCSSWLAALSPGDRVPVWARAGSMRLPDDAAVPLVFVGPGTGVAPFRSMLWERHAARLAAPAGAPPAASADLFFGNRREGGDYLYRAEWEELRAAGTLREVAAAFSRDGPQKVYVQHRMAERGALVWGALGPAGGGRIYVAGSAKQMPRDVRAAVVAIAARHGGMGEDEAEAYVKRMERERRYQSETWF